MEKIIKGDELMLFKGEKSIAYATSHTLTVNGNSIDISSKDHGYWGASEVGNITWEITSENLYTDKYYSELFDVEPIKGELKDRYGNILGYHEGIWNYTIGQRKGLKIAYSEPLYVLEIDKTTNSVIVGIKPVQ